MKVLLIGGIFGQTPEFRATNLQVTTETLLAEHLPAHGIEVATAAPALLNDLSGVDVIHAHHPANHCLQLSLRKPARVVFTRHRTGRLPMHQMPVIAGTMRRADALVALSDREATDLRRQYGEAKVPRIYNGVDSSRFTGQQRRSPAPGERWRFLYVGQLIPLKRVDLAIRLLAELKRAGVVADLAIASQRNTLEDELRALAAELGVADQVEFLGPLPQAEVSAEMQRSHLLLLPSRTEALPTVVTEAVLTCLPVLCFDVGGVREQLPAEQVVPDVADINGFYAVAKTMVDDYPQVAATYAAHRDLAADRFAIDRMVREHADLYRRLVG